MYQVKVLSNEEFENLPYPDMETSLGVADPKTNTAYVRYTGIEDVDKYLVNHELEHLIDGVGGQHSSHYRNGLYYKGFGEILQNIAGPVVGLFNPVAGAAVGAGSQLFGRKKPSGDTGGEPNVISAPQPQSSAMDSFKPSSPNIVSSGQGASGLGQASGTGAISQLSGARSPIERVRGFFSGRNPQGAF